MNNQFFTSREIIQDIPILKALVSYVGKPYDVELFLMSFNDFFELGSKPNVFYYANIPKSFRYTSFKDSLIVRESSGYSSFYRQDLNEDNFVTGVNFPQLFNFLSINPGNELSENDPNIMFQGLKITFE